MPNRYGKLVNKGWMQTRDIQPNVEFVLMPKHFHKMSVITSGNISAEEISNI